MSFYVDKRDRQTRKVASGSSSAVHIQFLAMTLVFALS
jgi:hypothetical protein